MKIRFRSKCASDRRKDFTPSRLLPLLNVFLLILFYVVLQDEQLCEEATGGKTHQMVTREMATHQMAAYRVMSHRMRTHRLRPHRMRSLDDVSRKGIRGCMDEETIQWVKNEYGLSQKLKDKNCESDDESNETGNGAVLSISKLSPKYLKKLVGEVYYDKINELPKNIKADDLFSTWHDIYGMEKNEFSSVEEDLWLACCGLAAERRVSKKNKINEWLRVYKKLSHDLMKKEVNDFNDLLIFMDNGSFTKLDFTLFVYYKSISWRTFKKALFKRWKKVLIRNLDVHRRLSE
ncbi:phist protein [Plasmodium cynomolgi strain B]|uniref:Phist protein n=1 Tax=Plasmodium cynomolgi (strain B) TaxID=1120755 RepID=K6UQW3_PLACD|nr:phist protein [Plasmodium cynomolgi strain B]GAB65379.1 phist protein [Plasmodium cynomolgi strain B]